MSYIDLTVLAICLGVLATALGLMLFGALKRVLELNKKIVDKDNLIGILERKLKKEG